MPMADSEGVYKVEIYQSPLTKDEIRVLSLLRQIISRKFAELTIQVHAGQVVSAEIREKIRL